MPLNYGVHHLAAKVDEAIPKRQEKSGVFKSASAKRGTQKGSGIGESLVLLCYSSSRNAKTSRVNTARFSASAALGALRAGALHRLRRFPQRPFARFLGRLAHRDLEHRQHRCGGERAHATEALVEFPPVLPGGADFVERVPD